MQLVMESRLLFTSTSVAYATHFKNKRTVALDMAGGRLFIGHTDVYVLSVALQLKGYVYHFQFLFYSYLLFTLYFSGRYLRMLPTRVVRTNHSTQHPHSA